MIPTAANVRPIATPAEHTSPATSTSRLFRILTSLLAGVVLMLAPTLITATPAQAATGYGTVTACFQSSATSNYGTYWGPYGLGGTAIVEVYYNGAWSPRTTVSTNSAGCAAMSVQAGYYWRMRVNDYRKPYRYVGTTPYAFVAYSGMNYGLGTTRIGSVYVG